MNFAIVSATSEGSERGLLTRVLHYLVATWVISEDMGKRGHGKVFMAW